MSIYLDEKAKKGGTYVVTASFYDEQVPPQPVTPNSGLSWSLTDMDGNIINNRDQVALTPATTVYIVLTGDDLALTGSSTRRVVLVEGTYNSTLGNDLPILEEAIFEIVDLQSK